MGRLLKFSDSYYGVITIMIPKVIHYCWFGNKELPQNLRKCVDSWKRFCPDYYIKKWDESNFDVASHPFMKKAYEEKAWAFVSDYARLKIIFENGGIYLDTDVELLKNLDFLLNYKCYVGIQQAGNLCATGLGFGAEKHNLIVKEMMEQYDGLEFDINNKNKLSCPLLNNRVLVNKGYIVSDKVTLIDDLAVLPSKMVDPIAVGRSDYLLCDESVSIHHYNASWESLKIRLKRRICIAIGQRNINAIKRVIYFWKDLK